MRIGDGGGDSGCGGDVGSDGNDGDGEEVGDNGGNSSRSGGVNDGGGDEYYGSFSLRPCFTDQISLTKVPSMLRLRNPAWPRGFGLMVEPAMATIKCSHLRDQEETEQPSTKRCWLQG